MTLIRAKPRANGRLQDNSFRHILSITPAGEVIQTELVECSGCHQIGLAMLNCRLYCGCKPTRMQAAADYVRNFRFDQATGR